VPLLVHNNRGGREAELLERYREPAWNNPVVRFFAGDGVELVPRKDGVYGAAELVARMSAALTKAGRAVPGYLALAGEELAPHRTERAVFAMPCFWRGEAVLGAIGGVRAVQAGWLEGREVVEVEYAAPRLPFAELLKEAQAGGCAARVWVERGPRLDAARETLGDAASELNEAPRPAGGSDHEHHLAEAGFAWLPLTPLQRVRVNASLADGSAMEDWLAPEQRAWLARGRMAPDRVRALTAPRTAAGLWDYRARLEQRLKP
jgi:hypothetical protein